MRGVETTRLSRQRDAERVHRLGPRVLFEFVDELVRHHRDSADDITKRLAQYAAVDPVMLEVTGGDRFSPLPLHLVGDGR